VNFFFTGQVREVTAMKDAKPFPLVLMRDVGWKQGKHLGIREVTFLTIDLLGMCSNGKRCQLFGCYLKTGFNLNCV